MAVILIVTITESPRGRRLILQLRCGFGYQGVQ
jgi:hypothetical protein